MILSIKGHDLFSHWAASLRSRRAHINPKCGFKLVSRAERRAVDRPYSRRPAGRRGRAAEPSAGQTGFRQELAGLHVQR